MEELLNKLIEKGWKPRGLLNDVEYIKAFKDVQQGWRVDISYEDHGYYKSIREILSKESGLWQFCVENGLVRKDRFTWMISPDPLGEDQYNYTDYRYRIIESALTDEYKLENFLLESIKLD